MTLTLQIYVRKTAHQGKKTHDSTISYCILDISFPGENVYCIDDPETFIRIMKFGMRNLGLRSSNMMATTPGNPRKTHQKVLL